jgi:hypothetical protein
MYLASAYPNSALSALTMMIVGLVVAASLALWLGLVYLADRKPRATRELTGAPVPGLRSKGAKRLSDEGRHRAEAPGGERDSRAERRGKALR